MKISKWIVSLCLLSFSLVSPATAQHGGEATAEVSIRAGAKKWPEANRWTARVKRSGEDRACYILEKEVPYGAPYPAIQTIDPDGRSLVVDSFDGVVELYDVTGLLVSTWKPFDGRGPDHERILKCLPANDGVLFLCSEPGSGNARLMKTDINLKVLWSRGLSGQSAAEMVVSGDGGIAAVCSYSSDPEFHFETTIMDAGGAVLRTLPFLFRTGDIDNEGDRLLLTDGRSVFLGNLRGGQSTVMWPVPEKESVVSGACLKPGGGCVLVVQRVQADGGGLRYAEPQLLVLDSESRIIGRRKLKGWSEHQATISLDSDTVTVGVGEETFQCRVSDLF